MDLQDENSGALRGNHQMWSPRKLNQ